MVGLADVLPPIDAALNATSLALVLLGWRAIRRRDVRRHRRLMLSAVIVSALFLVGYVTSWALSGIHRFEGPPWLRATYLAVLATHEPLAVATVPLVLRTVHLARSGRLPEHRRLVRWTLPIWLYVSATGIVVYAMLHHLSLGGR